jgi:pantoate--beta-alanine ligase
MRIVRDDLEALAETTGGVLVPTMGALHDGHAALIRYAASIAAGRPVVVSIFVNPTQFGPNEDYERYPRDLEADASIIEASGGEVIFAPGVAAVYPPGADDTYDPLPDVATQPGLEDRWRPGHFNGVCLVVRRLFDLVRPAAAIFGEKDYQQLRVLDAMTREAGLPIEIIGRPTVREPSGLAMSSRNRYLGDAERDVAGAISRALQNADGQQSVEAAEQVMRETLRDVDEMQYAVVRDAEMLMPVEGSSRGCRLRGLVAARVGSARLIDNAPVRIAD